MPINVINIYRFPLFGAMAKRIYCFGNTDIKEDRLALELADELARDKELKKKGIEFIKCTSPDFLLNINEKEIIILDVVRGLKDVQMITDLNRLNATKTTTMHDFDLGTVLKLLKEAGQLKNVEIIGIPSGADKKKTKKDVISFLS